MSRAKKPEVHELPNEVSTSLIEIVANHKIANMAIKAYLAGAGIDLSDDTKRVQLKGEFRLEVTEVEK